MQEAHHWRATSRKDLIFAMWLEEIKEDRRFRL
jgi:hypothetical protein